MRISRRLYNCIRCYKFSEFRIVISGTEKYEARFVIQRFSGEIIPGCGRSANPFMSDHQTKRVSNPLTVIQTFSEYLPQKLEDKEFLNKFAKMVGKEVSRINSLITQLLDFAKPAQPNMQNTDVNKLVSGVLNFLSSKFVEQKIRLKEKSKFLFFKKISFFAYYKLYFFILVMVLLVEL